MKFKFNLSLTIFKKISEKKCNQKLWNKANKQLIKPN